MQKKSQKSGLFGAMVLGTELGFLIALPLVVFLLLGIFLDRRFNTFPLFLILSVIFSLIATIFNVYHLVLPFLNKRSEDK